eukprot:TRINITY_DN65_c0_g5_i1.p1 TRINITY_DN65_c0_g5~~TRINITY_DN65_c0_g5_i1.p1  ORF type:complete len:279 (+),score=53.62 TRINITY_DN65_c0_g5_i1:50-838(+)
MATGTAYLGQVLSAAAGFHSDRSAASACVRPCFSRSAGLYGMPVRRSTPGSHASSLRKRNLCVTAISFPAFPGGLNLNFLSQKKGPDRDLLKEQLLIAISSLDRGAAATDTDKENIEELCQQLEAMNPTRSALKSPLLNGKWEMVYTTSEAVLATKRPKLLRPSGKMFQAINTDELAAQNLEGPPFFNQVTAKLEPVGPSKVDVQFQTFKILGLIPIKSPETARGQLEITYLDENMRISRGNRGNLFVLLMDDPDYKIPLPL